MINRFIERTNTNKFYNDCNFYLESKKLITSEKRLEVVYSINQNSYDIPIEYEEWKITCDGYVKSENLDNRFFMPYVKMAILDKHPSLWNFTEKKFKCYITGIPTDLREFYGNLLIELENASGNWIKLTDLFWNFEDYFKNEKKKYKEIPEPLLDVIKKACEDYDLSFEIKEEISMQEGANYKKDLGLLIFGNEIVSPHSFYLKQPYIIADSFEAIRVK
ncbi:hypothetical protein C8P64_1982 [Christiangramia gaetbulicola]|uniref:Uncharacterized protein n=1 Tax=Christiangramia gaetbulicola TaxID=703340 RepID=A0A2T6AI06_9FLAO|nr:hypothetical protein [Christiangramia gaetbulicola]PTX43454.1 hypothetical protein C8P64_1982 [Christiangramia gaetbulicola]